MAESYLLYRLTRLKNTIDYLKQGELAPIRDYSKPKSIKAIATYFKGLADGDLRKGFEEVIEEAKKMKPPGKGKRYYRLQQTRKVYCSICMEEKKYVDTFKFNCGHEFCKDCVRVALLWSNLCPYCKTVIKTVEGDHCYNCQWEGRYLAAEKVTPTHQKQATSGSSVAAGATKTRRQLGPVQKKRREKGRNKPLIGKSTTPEPDLEDTIVRGTGFQRFIEECT